MTRMSAHHLVREINWNVAEGVGGSGGRGAALTLLRPNVEVALAPALPLFRRLDPGCKAPAQTAPLLE